MEATSYNLMDIGLLTQYPTDLWEQILMNLSYKKIHKLLEDNLEIKDYCYKNNILNKKRYLGFPRNTNHCAAHDASFLNDLIPELRSAEEGIETLIRENDPNLHNILNKALDILIKQNFDLIYGDLVYFEGLDAYRNDGIIMFDGCELTLLQYDVDDYGYLPVQFVINGISPKYWNYDADVKGITHNCIIWLNIKDIRDQCVNNVKNDNNIISTTFKINDLNYKLYCIDDSNGEQEWENNEIQNKFIEILTEENLLMLDHSDITDLIEDDEPNSVYLNLNYYFYDKNLEF